MKQSRETCLHREKHSPGGGHAIGLTAFFGVSRAKYIRISQRYVYSLDKHRMKTGGLISVPQGGALFFYAKSDLLLLIHLILFEEGLLCPRNSFPCSLLC